MLSAGIDLRKIRDRLGLTMRDVETASQSISRQHGSDEYLIPPSRLSDIETKGVIPSVYRFYSLAAIYHRSVGDLLQLYGIDLEAISTEWGASRPAHTHTVPMENEPGDCTIPVKLDPAFDLGKTSNIGRMIQQWGTLPLRVLRHLFSQKYTYAYIGTEDFTMYPILLPGSFVQVDESEARRRVLDGPWRSEYERPIYLVETREGLTCCWCAIKANTIALHPHPLSPVQVRILKHPQEAEVIGQVVGIAMRTGYQTPPGPQD